MKKHTLFIILIIGIALTIGIWRDHQETVTTTETAKSFTPLPLNVGTALPQPKNLPDFHFQDMHENTFNNASLKDKWSFVFFGYSSCPDVCPTTLGSMVQIAQRIGKTPHVQYVFITIDPDRDSPAHLKTFLSQHQFQAASILGVTGNKEMVKDLASSIGIFFAQENSTNVNEHIEHSGAILLVNPEGKLTAIFTSSDKPNLIARDFKELVHHYMSSV
jgi:protein SCO1/2